MRRSSTPRRFLIHGYTNDTTPCRFTKLGKLLLLGLRNTIIFQATPIRRISSASIGIILVPGRHYVATYFGKVTQVRFLNRKEILPRPDLHKTKVPTRGVTNGRCQPRLNIRNESKFEPGIGGGKAGSLAEAKSLVEVYGISVHGVGVTGSLAVARTRRSLDRIRSIAQHCS